MGALFGAYITHTFAGLKAAKVANVTGEQVNLLEPVVFAFLLYGAMVPYWFSALTMRSVGETANAMVKEVARQWNDIEDLKMIAPGVLVIFTPIFTGIFFGWAAVAGLLAGALVSSVQLAISMSNTGGAWDNAKKYTEQGK